ncbi:MAG: hydroxymethylglutaryl-CoA synthase [Rickettsia sp.]|nr:hydroxymethylglutaryl-CoA synthase [Rickettsia sp.]
MVKNLFLEKNVTNIDQYKLHNKLFSNLLAVDVGIEKINFYTPGFFLDLKNLASKRDISYQKYLKFGQRKFSVLPPDEDIVTMAYNASNPILSEVNKKEIDLLLFATESSIDQSKSAGSYIHRMLELPNRCRIIELKHACYGGTAGLQMAMNMLRIQGYNKKILLIASDVSRYGFASNGESSQGSGAVAMLLSQNPQIIKIEPESGIYTEDVMDFWRPNYLDEALLNAKFSCQMYLKSLKKTWHDYTINSKRNLLDHQWFCYHVSVPRLIETAHLSLFTDFKHILSQEELGNLLYPSLIYPQIVGNCYTVSLFLSFLSLISNAPKNMEESRIGFYSYGSGSIGEFFSGVLQKNFKQNVALETISQNIASREEIDVKTYEEFYKSHIDITKKESELIPKISTNRSRIKEIVNHKRIYEISN